LEATLRVALDNYSSSSTPQEREGQGGTPDVWNALDATQLVELAQKDPCAFRHWEATVVPFIGPLRSPWNKVLKREGGGGAGALGSEEKNQLEQSLLNRITFRNARRLDS